MEKQRIIITVHHPLVTPGSIIDAKGMRGWWIGNHRNYQGIEKAIIAVDGYQQYNISLNRDEFEIDAIYDSPLEKALR
jgi:hypothetical protein